jgi:GTP-binding protein
LLNNPFLISFRLIFHIPTRGLIGLRSQLLNDTKGTAIMLSEFFEYQEYKGPLKKSMKGALISTCDGVCSAYGLKELEAKGTLFVKPGTKVIRDRMYLNFLGL